MSKGMTFEEMAAFVDSLTPAQTRHLMDVARKAIDARSPPIGTDETVSSAQLKEACKSPLAQGILNDQVNDLAKAIAGLPPRGFKVS